MDPKQLFNKALQQAATCIRGVQTHQLTNSTPCTEWDLKALLNHMVYELLWIPPLLQGQTIAEVGDQFDGDVLSGDFMSAWSKASDQAQKAVAAADPEATVRLSYGDRQAKDYIKETGTDIFIHTWDTAQAIACTLTLDEAIAKEIYDGALPNKDSFKNSGLFADPIAVPLNADIQTKLLGLLGRKAQAV
ncbi:MAG: hypothetical protein JWS12_423 [Candidatus Saccharibacteria bacterium]|nr:hypothetical protein [Candidatus Saccharibacteria bacterium]